MKFGKEFTTHLEETLPDWRDKYLSYKPLKKLLKKNIPSSEATADSSPRNPPPPSAAALPELQDWFVRILNEELEKVNGFYVDKEEEFIIRFQELKERIERVKNEGSTDGYISYDIEFSEEMMDIRKDFVSIHGEMVLLKNYSSLNFAGLVKILKKYDKRTGEVLRLNFTQLALHEPFFSTEPLTRLVQECEENLELLFPLEAEVLESAGAPQGRAGESTVASQGRAGELSSSHMNTETTLSLGEENGDIYRSTLSAMRTIQGLRRASSTYSPLSFSAVFANRGNESGGDITEENSADSLVNLDNAEEIDNEPACSSK